MQPMTYFTRHDHMNEIKQHNFDLLVIGGGVTGAGIALDAVSRGLSTIVIEMQDFAAGTSSRSTKLVHGGLRYLKQFDIEVVAEVGEERAIVYENAPHVTTPLWMMLPIIEHGTYGMFMSAVGLYIYDRLAKVKPSERRKMLTKEEALAIEPLLDRDRIQGAGYYVEYRTDDARLTIEILKEAVERGAQAMNYVKAEQLLYDHGRVSGAQVTDQLTGETFSIQAKAVVNATGPWVDHLREQDHSKQGKTMHLTKGIHLVVDQSKFPLQNPIYFDVPDGRMIFAIPRDGKTYVGTTDTNYKDDPLHPRTAQADRAYIIECIASMFPSIRLAPQDIESFWAGVRPLIHEEGKAPSEISRKDEVFTSKSQLITIAGGKLTGYRKMADKVVDHVISLLAQHDTMDWTKIQPTCQTATIALSGGKFGGSAHFPTYVADKVQEGMELGLTEQEAKRIVHRYGTNIDRVFSILRESGHEAQEFSLSQEVYAALRYGIEQEMVMTPTDFFVRRTSAMFFAIDWVMQYRDAVESYMAKRLHYTEEERRQHHEELLRAIEEATKVVS